LTSAGEQKSPYYELNRGRRTQTVKKIIKRNKDTKSYTTESVFSNNMKKYLITTIKRTKDGSKHVTTKYKPEIPMI
jgi:hypothetical protein